MTIIIIICRESRSVLGNIKNIVVHIYLLYTIIYIYIMSCIRAVTEEGKIRGGSLMFGDIIYHMT